MIAKKKTLKINDSHNSSLQSSLQKCKLNSSTCLQVQVDYDWIHKEKAIDNHVMNKILFVGSFAKAQTLARAYLTYRLRI